MLVLWQFSFLNERSTVFWGGRSLIQFDLDLDCSKRNALTGQPKVIRRDGWRSLAVIWERATTSNHTVYIISFGLWHCTVRAFEAAVWIDENYLMIVACLAHRLALVLTSFDALTMINFVHLLEHPKAFVTCMPCICRMAERNAWSPPSDTGIDAHVAPTGRLWWPRWRVNYKNSSEDEIANVNFLRRYGTYVLQNTKKENLLRLTN